MTPSRFQQVQQILEQVLAAGDHRTRDFSADIGAFCGDDAALAREVQSMLRHFHAVNDSKPIPAESAMPPVGFLDPRELHSWRYQHGTARSLLEEWGASAIGQRVADFTLLGQVGSGGMGVVFIAQQERPRRRVAVKLMRRQVVTPTMVKRFEREADLLGLLNHPGIAHVYAAGVTDLVAEEGIPPIRVPYIAMELVTGPTIAEYVIRAIAGRTNDLQHRLSAALPLVAQLCDAVHHAHARGVIHRDLKPANVLVSEEFGHVQVKVLDFGVARLMRTGSQEPDIAAAPADPEAPAPPCDQPALTIGDLTGHGNLIGTLSYMSPEQVRFGSKIDARADIYSMGAVLYELLTGKTPIETCDCTIAEAVRRIQHHLPEPLAAHNSNQQTPRPAILELQRILDRSLAKDPAERFSTALEMATELRRLLVRFVTQLHA